MVRHLPVVIAPNLKSTCSFPWKCGTLQIHKWTFELQKMGWVARWNIWTRVYLWRSQWAWQPLCSLGDKDKWSSWWWWFLRVLEEWKAATQAVLRDHWVWQPWLLHSCLTPNKSARCWKASSWAMQVWSCFVPPELWCQTHHLDIFNGCACCQWWISPSPKAWPYSPHLSRWTSSFSGFG